MKKKIVSIAAVLLTLVMGIAGCGKEEGYRNIQVYEVNGSATIERENVGSMDAYENLNLLSGDWMGVAEKSYSRLKMDEDKYIFVEEGSELNIIATGSEKDAKTNIQLTKGAVTVEVQNKLAEDASFEVTTPNSVMAIRGTVVRIAVDTDEKGEPITVISVLEGSASIQKIDKDGTVSEEQILDYGKEAVIYEDEETDIIIVVLDEIDTMVFPTVTLEFLQEIAEERRELVVPLEELKQIIEEKKAEEQPEESTESEDSTEIPSESETEISDSEESSSEENNVENRLELPKQPVNTEVSSENSEEEEQYNNWWDLVPLLPSAPENTTPESEKPSTETPSTEKPETEKPSTEKPETEKPSTEKPETEKPSTEKPEPEKPSTEKPEPDTSEPDTSEPDTSEPDTSEPDTSEPAKKTFKVTFTYKGEEFGTQTVEEGGKATEPILRPAPAGSWVDAVEKEAFDFDTVITADTVIEFIELAE